MVKFLVEKGDLFLLGDGIQVSHVDVASEVNAFEEGMLRRRGPDQGQFFPRGGNQRSRGFTNRGCGEGENVGLQLTELEAMKTGVMLEIEETGIFGWGWRLLRFVVDRNQCVAAIRMVGGCAGVYAGGMGAEAIVNSVKDG